MSTDIAISLKNVSKYYKLYDDPKYRLKEALHPFGKIYHQNFHATNNISLEIKKGEILGIVGKNGSGKSTLLKLITNVLTPDKGSIKVNGKISALLELGSGFNPDFTGLQNIFFYGMILGFSKKDMDDKLNDIIAFADIGDFISQPIKIYSSGMRARLGFAVAVHIDPEILILDEVLSVGDVLFKRKCYAKMEEFFKGGKTIIYVSHDANSVRELCTRAIFLESGSIILDGDAKTVTTYYEKYIFAKEGNKEKVKNEIKELLFKNNEIASKKEPIVLKELKAEQKNKKTIVKQDNQEQNENAFFIPDFISKSRIAYDDTQVEVFDVCIKTSEGKIVNALIHGYEYFFCYKLKFKANNKSIASGMTIKTEKGLKISSCGSITFNETIESVKKNETYELVWKFYCNLLPGTYFTDVGVTNSINNERKLINNIIDAMPFKVLPVSNKFYGLVSLDQSPKFYQV